MPRQLLRLNFWVQIALAYAVLLLLVTWSSSSFNSIKHPSATWEDSWEDITTEVYDTSSTAAPRPSDGSRPSSSHPLQRLEDALHKLETTRISSYQEARSYNEETCSGRGVQSNQDQIKGESQFWQELSVKTLRAKRDDLVKAVRETFDLPKVLQQTESTEESAKKLDGLYGRGRGIVFTGGNADTLQRTYISLRILRHRHGCKLPVEIFAFPEELRSSSSLRTQIEGLGNVEFKELHSSPKLKLWKNFQIKGESILKSSFAEVLYLDSDNILLTDPTYLFEHPMYQEHRAVFWPDITKDGPANPIWRTFGIQCKPKDWQLDSGQILIDKRGQYGFNLAALVIAAEMQSDHPFWFKISGGDKDTFRYGFYALNLQYTASPHWLSSFGLVHNYAVDGHSFCGLAMFQYGLSPEDWVQFPQVNPPEDLKKGHAPPLFVHANLLKHSSGYRRDSTFTTLKRMVYDNTSMAMDRPRSVVYHSRNGMCVDIWDSFDEVDPRPQGEEEAHTFENGEVILEKTEDAFGGLLREFEKMYYDEGGKAGGF